MIKIIHFCFLLHSVNNILAANFTCSNPSGIACSYDEARDVHICDDNSFCLFDVSVDGLCCSIFDIILNPSFFEESTDGCYDSVDARTGQSICSSLAYLCYNQMYFDFMTQECPKTCRRCSETRNFNKAVEEPFVRLCEDKTNPTTGLSDCPINKGLCNNSYYGKLMEEECPETCGLC
ncbi:unnamed protein product [Auanema sp. JU1783]|nr:unnamed protein product [Auanema sp. JU1783]